MVGPNRRRTAASWAGIIRRSLKSARTTASSVAPIVIGPMGVWIWRTATELAASGWQRRQAR